MFKMPLRAVLLVGIMTFALASSALAQSGAEGAAGDQIRQQQVCQLPTVPAGFTVSQVNATPILGPAGLAFPPLGSPFGSLLYVADTSSLGGTGNILTVDQITGSVAVFTPFAGGVDLEFGPGEPFGTDLYALDGSWPGSLSTVAPNGTVTPFVFTVGGVDSPGDMEFDAPGGPFGGLLLITDDGSNHLSTVDEAGVETVIAGDPTLLRSVEGLALGPGGPFGTDAFVGDSTFVGQGRVLTVTPGGAIAQFTAARTVGGAFAMAFFKGSGDMFVADAGCDAIWRISGPFNQNLFVTDGDTNTIVEVDSAGNVSTFASNFGGFSVLGGDIIFTSPELTVPVDIKPTSCPNPLNVKSKGVLPVAILGTEDLDVTSILPESVRLEGVVPIRSNVEDVSEPLGDPQDACACGAGDSDGYPDLTLKFDTQEVVNVLGEFTDRENRTLRLTAELADGTMIQGADCVIILSKGSKSYEGIKIKGGKFTRLDFIDPSTIAETKDRPGNLIYGLIQMEIEVDKPGATATVTVSLPVRAPTRYGWYKYGPNRSWYDFSANAAFNATRDQVTITLTDGDIGDDDGVVNGTIVDPSGLGTAPASNGGTSISVGSGGGGGGCFIATAAYGSRMAKEVEVLEEVRDEYLLANELGKALVSAYYKHSPTLADWIVKHPMMRKIVRIGLYPILELCKWFVGENPSKYRD